MNNAPPFNFPVLLRTAGIVLALGIFLALPLLSCRLPGTPSPTPFVFTTPDKTLTAIFAPLLTLTPQPLRVYTATPDIIRPSPFPTATPPTTPVSSISPVPSPTRPEPKLRSGALVQANYLESPPLLDGILDEWGWPSFPARNLVYGGGEWQGEADVSATFMLGWDSANLYLAVQVRDDRYVQEASGLNIFKGDSLEILLDADLAGDFEEKSLNADDHQLGISPGLPYPGQAPQAYLWYPVTQRGGRPDVSMAARAREGGYNVEVAVPWSLFGITPQIGDAFGFACSISDNDLEGEQVQQSMVSNVSRRDLTDPTTWGSLVLLKP
jgi:hypothetical protein